MPGEGDEQPVKKAKIHSLRKFDDKIAVQKQRQEEANEHFKEAMRNIGQLKDPMSLTQLRTNLPRIHHDSVDIPSPQGSSISMRSPPSNIDFRAPGRLEWDLIHKDLDEMSSRKYPYIKRGSGRRRSTGHASNDIRNSTSPYPVIRHEPIGASYPPQMGEMGLSSSLISRVKSDSDLQRSLENSSKDSPLAGHTTPSQTGSTPTPTTSHLHPPQSIPQQWRDAAKYRQNLAAPGSTRKQLSSLRKRSHNFSEQIDNYFPSPTQPNAYINPKVTSLPDLTDINFHSGLDNPLDYDEFSNMPYTPTEPLMGGKPMTSQQLPPIPGPFLPQAPPLFQQQQPHDRILNQANQFGYFDDAYLHLQSEPHFSSGPKKMFNSSLSIPESYPLSYPPYPPNFVANPHMQPQGQLQNGMEMLPDPFPIGLTGCNPDEMAPSVISEPGMGLYSRENMFERPTSSRSMPPHPPHTRDFSQSQQFRGLDLHFTPNAPIAGYGNEQMPLGTGLMLNPNLHKSDPLLQSIGAEGNVMQNFPGQLGFPGILEFEESPIGPELCIPEDLQFGSLRKGHSYDFKTAIFGGNKTPVPGSYTNLSKFSSFPEIMSDGGLNPRDFRAHAPPFMIDNTDSVIERLIEHDAATQLNTDPIPEDAQKFFQNGAFAESFFLK